MSSQSNFDLAFDRIAALANAKGLTDIVLSTSYGSPALKVRDRTFVRLLDEETIVLQCPFEQKVLLMEISPAIYFETDHYVGHDAVLVRLAAIDDEELSLRLQDAWQFKAPQGGEPPGKEED